MLVVKSSTQARQKRSDSRVGLAVAGGGPVGGIFEIGAVRALDDALDGLDMHDLDIYVGISSGAFVAASLANRLSSAELCRIFITGDSDQFQFRAEDFIRPAIYEYLHRLAGVPRMLATTLADFARHPFDMSLSDSLMRLGSILPTGLFDNSAIERFLRKAFGSHGRSNDFRELSSRLILVAVELESGETVRFGTRGHDSVPISRAIEASSALPGLYPPVQIDGKHYVDGALRYTVHASVALDAGADLVLAINPLVPINTMQAKSQGKVGSPNVVDGGLPAVLSQMFRTLLESRVQSSIPRYERTYPGSDLMLLQPDTDDTDMFFTNVFSFSHRKRLAEHAYQSTLRDLRANRKSLKPLLARHGITLRDAVLDDTNRTLLSSLSDKPPRRSKVTSHLHRALDDLDRALSADSTVKPQAARRKPPVRRRTRSAQSRA